MSGIAIVMLALFAIVIWGGLGLAISHLLKHPDETSGELGTAPEVHSDVLQEMERI